MARIIHFWKVIEKYLTHNFQLVACITWTFSERLKCDRRTTLTHIWFVYMFGQWLSSISIEDNHITHTPRHWQRMKMNRPPSKSVLVLRPDWRVQNITAIIAGQLHGNSYLITWMQNLQTFPIQMGIFSIIGTLNTEHWTLTTISVKYTIE